MNLDDRLGAPGGILPNSLNGTVDQDDRRDPSLGTEDQVPPKREYLNVICGISCYLLLAGMIGFIYFTQTPPQTVSFQTTIAGFRLPSLMKTTKITIPATGHGHSNATSARGEITFYNGQPYTQIIPIDTILKGMDGVSNITDAQAVIPPVAQTLPPTDGQTSVPAHAVTTGTRGNIQAGDINMPCCVTSVIAQNHTNFTGGKNARDFIYLTDQDVRNAVSSLIPTLEEKTIAGFNSPIVFNPTCVTTGQSSPAIGKETREASLTLTTVCKAISYSLAFAKQRIVEAGKQYGSLSSIQFAIVGISEKKGVVTLHSNVSAVVKPNISWLA